jgi:site-specific DNA-methyltransferase (adenine-specific)
MYWLYPTDCISGAAAYIPNGSVDLIITDPPYAIGGDSLHRHYHRDESIVIDGYAEIEPELYHTFCDMWIRQAERILRPGGSAYIISGYTNLGDLLLALRETCLIPLNHIIWKYNFGVYTTKKYISSHYHILYYYKPGARPTFNTYARYGPDERNNRNRSLNYNDREDVWVINRAYKPGQIKNKNELPHELLIKMIQYSSNQGDMIADFFLGGFSTAEVAIGLERQITGFEINPVSFNHHINRIRNLNPGYLLEQVKTGTGHKPYRQRQRWSEGELVQLQKRFKAVYRETGRKQEAIRLLEGEFGRGYFAILNQINRMFG